MSAVERVRAAYDAIDAAQRPEIWIMLRPLEDALADARSVGRSRVERVVDQPQL